MGIYDDDNYYITFGERRQSREEWIAFGDETDGKYDPSYDAANGSDCVTGYTHFPDRKTDGTANGSPRPQQSGCLGVILLLVVSFVVACTSNSSHKEDEWAYEDTVVVEDVMPAVMEMDSAKTEPDQTVKAKMNRLISYGVKREFSG